MKLWRRLFGNQSDKPEAATKPINTSCFPLFLFDWSDISDKVSSSYGNYAKRELKERLTSQTPMSLDSNWRGFHGDLLAPESLAQFLGVPEIIPDLSLVREETAAQLRTGSPSTIYIIGIGNSRQEVVRHVDNRLKEAGVIGYLGVLRFNALHQSDADAVRSGLSLPTFGW